MFVKTKFALALLLLAGCAAGPGNKPGTMTFKKYKEVTPLAVPAASWNKGDLRYELTKVEMIRSYTVLKTLSYRLYFSFKVLNQGNSDGDVLGQIPKASLTLQDGTFIERLVSTASTAKLAPGKEVTGMYFSDNSLAEGARPQKLAIEGKQVASW